MMTLMSIKLNSSLLSVTEYDINHLVTEQYAKLGFGAVLIDQQHGLLDERTAFECVQRLEKFPDCFPIVRVCDNSSALILDAAPPDANKYVKAFAMIETAEAIKNL